MKTAALKCGLFSTMVTLCLSACGGAEPVAEQGESVEHLESATFCGGIAGLACPDGYACVDDPKDECDPQHGGADCGGICVKDSPKEPKKAKCDDPDPSRKYVSHDPKECALIHFVCSDGFVPFFDDSGCGCEAGERCGKAVCGPGTYCCNPLRDLCVPEGNFCIQSAAD